MNEMVKKRWTAMDGSLVFDFTLNREPGDGIPSIASVSCQSGPAESQLVTITPQWPGKPFEFRFRSDAYVSGYLQQKTPVHIDGVTHTAIFADIRYGMKGQRDDHHFEGIMVACPTRAPVPDPWPPVPLPIPIDTGRPLPLSPLFSLPNQGHAMTHQETSNTSNTVNNGPQGNALPLPPNGSSVRLFWPASSNYRFVFVLYYDDNGQYVTMQVDVQSAAGRISGDGYTLPVAIQTPPGVEPPESIRMTLIAASAPYSHALRCAIDVPGFVFEGVAFEFSAEYGGPPPQTVW